MLLMVAIEGTGLSSGNHECWELAKWWSNTKASMAKTLPLSLNSDKVEISKISALVDSVTPEVTV